MIKTNPLSELVKKHIGEKRRMMEFQIRGRFKEEIPPGQIFFGGEIKGKMKLGMLMRGFAKAMLAVAGRLSPGVLHFSFGSDKEQSHIVTSLLNAVERFVITPEGEIPPPLDGRQLEESDADAKARRKAQKPPDITLKPGPTY